MRYKLRSALTRVTEPLESAPGSPESPQLLSATSSDAGLKTPSCKRRKVHRRKTKVNGGNGGSGSSSTVKTAFIFTMPEEIILMLVERMDVESSLCFLRTCKHFHRMLKDCETFWRILCQKCEFCMPSCLEHLPDQRVGYSGKHMYINREEEASRGTWTKIWRRGIQMRRNIASANFQGWRLYSNSSCPLVELTSDLDLNKVKERLGDFPRLSHSDDLKLDWDDKYLVVFHFMRGDSETCTIRLWDIEDVPEFLYEVDKGNECITDKVCIHAGYVVITPSWPLDSQALVMTLDINKNMEERGRYLFPDEESQVGLDMNWDHTQLRVVRCNALVTCRAPDWRLLVTSLPDCVLLRQISLTVTNLFECQQIRSYKGTAVILFSKEKGGQDCSLVTVDVTETGAEVRSTYYTLNITDVALYTDPEEIYLVMKDGGLMMYDATNKHLTKKITNPLLKGSNGRKNSTVMSSCDYQLFVNGKEQICIVQSAPEAPCGRNVRVYSYEGDLMYTINLDIVKYGLSRDESVCLYTHSVFLLVADSKRFVMFDVKTGKYIGVIHIPCHLERSKGKDEKDCMFDQSSLGMFVFDENRLIAVHDYERNFPAVLDILNFW